MKEITLNLTKEQAEDLEYTKEHCPNVYEKVQALKGEAEEIMNNKGLGAAFKFIVDNIYKEKIKI